MERAHVLVKKSTAKIGLEKGQCNLPFCQNIGRAVLL